MDGFTMIEILAVVVIMTTLAVLILPVANHITTSARKSKCIANMRGISQGFSFFLQDNNLRFPGNGPGANVPVRGENNGSLRWPCRIGYYMDIAGPERSFDAGNGTMVSVRDHGHNQAIFHCPLTPSHYYQRWGGVNWSVGEYGANPYIISNMGAEYNIWGISVNTISHPSRTVLVADRYAGGGERTEDERLLMGASLNPYGVYPSWINGVAANHRSDRNPAKGKGTFNVLFVDGHVEAIKETSLTPWPASDGSTSPIIIKP